MPLRLRGGRRIAPRPVATEGVNEEQRVKLLQAGHAWEHPTDTIARFKRVGRRHAANRRAREARRAQRRVTKPRGRVNGKKRHSS
jgi:hypothetical protein